MGKVMACFDVCGYGAVVAGMLGALMLGGACLLGGAVSAAWAAEGPAGLAGIAAADDDVSLLAGIGGEQAVPIASSEEGEDILLATYGNAAQGFSLLVDAGSFTVGEGERAGATFTSNADSSSYFAVSYVADWEGTPDVGEYLEEQLWHGQMEHGDTYVQISADGGEAIYLAGVGQCACAYGYVDEQTGQNMTVIQAMEPRSDGSAVYWTLCSSDESMEQVATALVWASATFRVGAEAYTGSNMWCAASDLAQRPSGSVYSLVDDADAANAQPDATSGDAGASSQPDAASGARDAGATSAIVPTYQLATVDGGCYTVTLPQGWVVNTSGSGAGFCFEAYDPADPHIRIIYYGEMAFNLSEQTRELWALSAGSNQLSALYAALPILDPCTVANAVSLLPAYTELSMSMAGAVDDGTSLLVSSAEVTASQPVSYASAVPALAAYVSDDALVSADLVLTDGTACRADFLGSAIAVGYADYGGMAAVEGLWGIVAPADIYDSVVDQLAPCICTLSFSDEYVAQSNAANDAMGAAALARSAQNNAMMDQVMQDFDDYIMDRDRFTFSDGSQLVIEH